MRLVGVGFVVRIDPSEAFDVVDASPRTPSTTTTTGLDDHRAAGRFRTVSSSGPMVTASLPVVVCSTTTGVPTTTTSLPPSVSVSVPTSEAQQGNLAVYTDEAGRLMLVGPTVGWTCNGSFGADGSGCSPSRRSGPACRSPDDVAPAVVFEHPGDRRHGERRQPGAGCDPRLSVLQRGEDGGPAGSARQLLREQSIPRDRRAHVGGPGRIRGSAGCRRGWVSLGWSERSERRGAVQAEANRGGRRTWRHAPSPRRSTICARRC